MQKQNKGKLHLSPFSDLFLKKQSSSHTDAYVSSLNMLSNCLKFFCSVTVSNRTFSSGSQLPSKRVNVSFYSQSTQREEKNQLVAENKIIFTATVCLTFPNSNNLEHKSRCHMQ